MGRLFFRKEKRYIEVGILIVMVPTFSSKIKAPLLKFHYLCLGIGFEVSCPGLSLELEGSKHCHDFVALGLDYNIGLYNMNDMTTEKKTNN